MRIRLFLKGSRLLRPDFPPTFPYLAGHLSRPRTGPRDKPGKERGWRRSFLLSKAGSGDRLKLIAMICRVEPQIPRLEEQARSAPEIDSFVLFRQTVMLLADKVRA